jgi:hypothetical protein
LDFWGDFVFVCSFFLVFFFCVLLFFVFLSLSCVPNVADVSGFSVLYCTSLKLILLSDLFANMGFSINYL